MEIIFKIIGAIGLILITVGILAKNEKRQNWLFITGGLALEAYSVYIGDVVFIVLQIVFVIAAIYELIILSKKNAQTRS